MLPQRTRFERVLCAVVALLVTAHTTSAVSTDAGARHLPRRLLTTDDYYEGEVMAQTSPFLTRANDKTVGDPDAPPHPPQAPHHAFGGLHFPPDPPLKLQPNYRPPFSTGVGTDDAPAPPIHHSENSSDNVVAGEDRTDFDADHEDFDAGVRMPGLHLLAGGGIIAAAVGVAVVHRRRRSKVLAPVYEPIPNTASAVYGSMEAMQPPRL